MFVIPSEECFFFAKLSLWLYRGQYQMNIQGHSSQQLYLEKRLTICSKKFIFFHFYFSLNVTTFLMDNNTALKILCLSHSTECYYATVGTRNCSNVYSTHFQLICYSLIDERQYQLNRLTSSSTTHNLSVQFKLYGW